MSIFKLELTKAYWINENEDDPEDLCLHGDVTAVIDNNIINESCTVSAAAMHMLRSLTEDHNIDENATDGLMLPCCGHFMVAGDDGVFISGCGNGTDWSVKHMENDILLILSNGDEAIVSSKDYREEVIRFADQVENFYNSCSPKVFSDDFDQNGYTSFWNEFHRRKRNA